MRRARHCTEHPMLIVTALRRCAQTRPPPDLAVALVRTVCYAWTTTARIHDPVRPCHFCGQTREDRQFYYLGCVVFHAWLHHRAGLHHLSYTDCGLAASVQSVCRALRCSRLGRPKSVRPFRAQAMRSTWLIAFLKS